MIGSTSQFTGKSEKDLSLEKSARRVLLAQVFASVLVLVAIAVYTMLFGSHESDQVVLFGDGIAGKLWSSLYGSALAIASTILGVRSVRRASRVVVAEGDGAMVPIFSGLLNKLVIVGGGIAFGLVALGLSPVYVVISYLFVQLSSVSLIVRSGTGRGSGVEKSLDN